jgi:hypothetical protein
VLELNGGIDSDAEFDLMFDKGNLRLGFVDVVGPVAD